MGVVFYEMWRQPFFTAMERAQVQFDSMDMSDIFRTRYRLMVQKSGIHQLIW